MARQTGAMVIAISPQRRNIITLYIGMLKYVLKEIPVILSRANQALQTLEKYQRVLNKGLVTLSALEFEDLVTLSDVAKILIRAEKVRRIACEVERSIIELGTEGRLIDMQMEELMHAEDTLGLLIKDYAVKSRY
jgi:diadenylate cyclase